MNATDEEGRTALHYACQDYHSDTVRLLRLLLRDPRVDTTLADVNNRTPLWNVCLTGRKEGVEWLVASGKDLGDLTDVRKDFCDDNAVRARQAEYQSVVMLVKRFLANPAQTRQKLRVTLGVLDELAAGLFSIIVFLCDGLLQLTPALAADPATSRFFNITRRLPMELQMIVCHQVYDSAKESVLSKDSEAAFKSLAKTLLAS